ncbi:MAG TPA: DEAD/DEAH box helicase, partial [Candidatus Paceibacterota bacterium]|nr:DEAD/DEAH box helicase [Candidatus Paceibacterota bacterium]
MHLHTPLSEAFRLMGTQKAALQKLGILTIRDLLYHFPARYTDVSEMRSVANLEGEKSAVVYGRLTKLETKKARFKKMPYAEGELEDGTGKIKIIWWNQPFIAKTFQVGALVRLDGPIQNSTAGKRPYMSNPEISYANELPLGASDTLFDANTEETIYGVYPESRGITSRWFYHKIAQILKDEAVLEELIDPIPQEILEKYHLPALKTALFWIHRPKKTTLAKSARKRFAFEEIFFIQLSRQLARKEYEQFKTFQINAQGKTLKDFESRLPFTLTAAQKKSIKHVMDDLKKPHPMSRLLEGDVGSGKTAVAALSSYAVVNTRPEGQNFGNLQVAYMAPTEVLARQLFESFIEYFAHLPIQIGLITGSECRKFPSKANPSTHTH